LSPATGKHGWSKVLGRKVKIDGDVAAIRYIYDRLDGRPKESIELTDSAVDNRLKEIMSYGE